MSYELQSLKGKVVLISGATSGVGRATAIQMVNEGAKVVLNSRNDQELSELVQQLGESNATHFAGDIGLPATSKELANKAIEKFQKIDIVIPGAGIGFYGSILDWSDDEINQMIRTNFDGTVHLIRASVPTLVAQGKGDIIIVSSVAGFYGAAKEAVYAGTKHAQVGLAAGLDHELREKGVRVSLIAPSGISTNFAFGTGRSPDSPRLALYLKPEDVAAQIVYLAKQPASMRTTLISMISMEQQSN